MRCLFILELNQFKMIGYATIKNRVKRLVNRCYIKVLLPLFKLIYNEGDKWYTTYINSLSGARSPGLKNLFISCLIWLPFISKVSKVRYLVPLHGAVSVAAS